jgi:uncharacterized protein (DUF1697 family)
MALLRGINVGGKNKVRMADLRTAFEDDGFDAVETYIQSGNVLFETDAARDSLEGRVEALLDRDFDIPVVAAVRSHRQLRGVVQRAPAGFGQSSDVFHSDVVFLKAPLTPAKAMAALDRREGVDEAWAGSGVVYFQRLSAERTKSRLSRITGRPEYAHMTIRNWNTTTTLLEMLDARQGSGSRSTGARMSRSSGPRTRTAPLSSAG